LGSVLYRATTESADLEFSLAQASASGFMAWRVVGLLEQRLQGDKHSRRGLATIVKQLRVSK